MAMDTRADDRLAVPHPDDIRVAIDVADERARMLRRLLRVAMRLHAPIGPATPGRRPVASRSREAARAAG